MAQNAGNPELTPVHLLAALVGAGSPAVGAPEEDGGIVVPVLEKAGAHVSQIRSMAEAELRRLPQTRGGSLSLSRQLAEVFQAAGARASRMKTNTSRRDLLLALGVASDAKEIRAECGRQGRLLRPLKRCADGRVTTAKPEVLTNR